MYILFIYSECNGLNPVPAFSGPVRCHMLRSCQTIECCIDVEPLGRTIYAHMTVDACNATMKLGIEKYTQTRSLVNYEFGVQDQLWLNDFLKMRYYTYDENSTNPLLSFSLISV